MAKFKNPTASAMGRLGGSARTALKRQTSRANLVKARRILKAQRQADKRAS